MAGPYALQEPFYAILLQKIKIPKRNQIPFFQSPISHGNFKIHVTHDPQFTKVYLEF